MLAQAWHLVVVLRHAVNSAVGSTELHGRILVSRAVESTVR